MFVPTAAATNDINQVAPNGSPAAADALREHPLFRELRPDTGRCLLEAATPLRLEAGQWLFREGDAARHCLLVLAGRVEVLRMGRDGEPCRVRLPLQIRQIAGRLGVRPETLSRLLSDWQRAGHLRGQQRDWEILDPEHLADLASASRRSF